MYLLVGAAEGWRRGVAWGYPCAALGYAVLRYGVGVAIGVGVVRISGRCFVALLAWRASEDKRCIVKMFIGTGGCGVCVGEGGVFVGVGLGL